MKYYPIHPQFEHVFRENETLLLGLIQSNSRQLRVILQRIDICDFSMRCLRFYNSDEYQLKNNTIIYTNQITKEKSYCSIQNNAIHLSSKKGFALFMERYFPICFCASTDFTSIAWFSYQADKASFTIL